MSSSPETGLKNERPNGRYSVIRFHVSEHYSEREIEDLFEQLEGRGAYYKRVENLKIPGWFELSVPRSLPYSLYAEALAACESVDKVENLVVITDQVSIKPED